MQIKSMTIQNFRKLKNARIDIGKQTTLFVGANNSGKTSAMDAVNKFLANRSFSFNDITISNRKAINDIGEKWADPNCEKPTDLLAWDPIVPMMDIWLDVPDGEIHYVASLIPTLDWAGGDLGVRLAYFPANIEKLFSDFRKQYNDSRKTENSDPSQRLTNTIFPKNLCDFLSKKISSYFSLKAFILDPADALSTVPSATKFERPCLTNDPLKGIIKVDTIDAQRGFSDPDSVSGELHGKRLSKQMSDYYRKHLDPEMAPMPEDLDVLSAAADSKKAFDAALTKKFQTAIKELEDLGYPGVANPKITLESKVSSHQALEHESAVQYALSKSDDSLKLPEKYNGLGYQNLISIVFDLMEFRDSWKHIGKSYRTDSPIEPLHLVLVEEPEAHLHVQVQQVFIRKAYGVLTRYAGLSTQLIISTHSSNIARECDFSDLRYFKRISENPNHNIATSEVVNLSDVFGEKDDTSRFVTRYLQSTHCDLFFADAAILVEGAAESMLVPHFIHSKYRDLYNRYITILSINGRHSHRLGPLLNKLCIPVLVITDLDPAKKEGNKYPKVRPERGKGYISSNYAITKWLLKESSLDTLLDKKPDDKVKPFTDPYSYDIRLAYQTPIKVRINDSDEEVIPSTFEDSLIFTNYDLFMSLDISKADGMLKKTLEKLSSSNQLDKICSDIYELLHKKMQARKRRILHWT